MNTTVSVIKTGNSAAVVLPAGWRRQNAVEVGDLLVCSADAEGRIIFEKPQQKENDMALQHLYGLIDALPNVPWTRGDSKKDDRELLAERYDV